MGLFDSVGSFIGDAAGGLMGGLFPNPATGAMVNLDQIEGKVKPYYDPYIESGRRQISPLETEYARLMGDPASLMRSLGANYQEDPGYQYEVSEATKAANNAAAAGGMLGTPAEQASLARTISGLSNRHYTDFLDRALNLYGTGLKGREGLMNTGYDASKSLSDIIANVLGAKSSLAYQGQQQQNNMVGQLLGTAMGAAAGGFGGSGGGSGGMSQLMSRQMARSNLDREFGY